MTPAATTKSFKTVFKINGITFTIKPLTIAQFRKFSALLGKIAEKEMTGWGGLLEHLVGDGLEKFMVEIVFPGQSAEKIKWDDVDFNIAYEVIESFLSLNPKLKVLSTKLFSIFAPMMAAVNPET